MSQRILRKLHHSLQRVHVSPNRSQYVRIAGYTVFHVAGTVFAGDQMTVG